MPKGPGGVICLWGRQVPLIEPAVKRVIALVDGQNLYRSAMECFAYHYPNYDIRLLAEAVCATRPQWTLSQVRFYTGVPPIAEDPFWHRFWQAKLLAMKRQKIHTFSRHTRNQREKGIDVQIAIDAIRLAHNGTADVLLIFSQDQDLSGVVTEVKTIAREQNRWIRVACAFPYHATAPNGRGINNSEWIRIDRTLYDAFIDPRDYRSPTPAPGIKAAAPSPP